jgi:rare lipoprotein A
MCGRGLIAVGFLVIAGLLGACAEDAKATPSAASTPPAAAPLAVAKKPDQRPAGGDAKVGNASIYSNSLQGKRMADGKPYDPHAPVAASKTLPLGTVAKVTNLENGKSTHVRVEDRGPMVKGRVVDLAPAAASKLGLTQKKGIARVEVKPVAPAAAPEVVAGP